MEKATELGIRGIYPVITDNCAVKREVASSKTEKWQKVTGKGEKVWEVEKESIYGEERDKAAANRIALIPLRRTSFSVE
jgi:hypothetical protein